ncbi:MAG: beta-ketoacyl-ACP synthase II [Chloroflexota bacterium]
METSRDGRHVVITGIGPITPIGNGVEGLWQGVLRGQSAVRRITRFDPAPFSSQVAAQIEDFDPLDHMDAKRARRLDRFSQFSLACVRLALADAGLDVRVEDPGEVGIYVGSALGGTAYGEEQHAAFLRSGLRGVSPFLALSVFGGASSSNIAIALGVTGPNVANANSCASGAIALGEAFRLIRAGGASVVLAGGVEAPLAPLTFGAFSLIRVMSEHNGEPEVASRPFDRRRDGFVMAEGGCVLVLEERDHAVRRGARIYAEIAGYGLTNDAYHMTAPLPTGAQAARAMTLALREAGVAPDEVGYVNAHASGTVLNDRTETQAIKLALGDHAYRVPISGTKGMHGHALGATGAIEVGICCLAMCRSYLPPTVNLREPDPACDLDYLPACGRRQDVSSILTNSFGFGGINAALLLARPT